VRVVVADEVVVDHRVEEPREVDHGRARYVAEQPETLLERRPAFLLVFEFGDDAKSLAKIFLMKAFERRRATGGVAVMAVITLHNQEIDAVDAPRLDARGQQSGRHRELHAERLVEDHALETLDGRLEDVSARRAPERHGNFAAFDPHRNFVLCAGERQAYALVAREQRTLRQLSEDARQFLVRELPIVIVALRQRAARRDESDRPGAFAADPLQHRVIVARADAEITGDDLALGFFGQDAGKEGPAFFRLEAFLSERQGLRERHSAWLVQPGLRVCEQHLAAIVLDQLARNVIADINIESSGHGFRPLLAAA